MDLERLNWIYPFDVEVLTRNFMLLRLKTSKASLQSEDLVAFAADQMGKFAWHDPDHYLYDWLISQAEYLIEKHVDIHTEEKLNESETYEEPDRDW